MSDQSGQSDQKVKKRLLDFSQVKFEVRDVMRYDDVGDYFGDTIVAYNMHDDVINNAILIHEFVEYVLIKSAGLTSEMIDMFDTDEEAWKKYPKEYALYDKFHDVANMVERQFIENLGLDWETHDKIINTAPIKTAVRRITGGLHKPSISQERIDQTKKIVDETLEK